MKRGVRWAAWIGAAVMIAGGALAQTGRPGGPGGATPVGGQRELRAPNMAEGVLKALEVPYLTEAERSALRVFHGVWTEADLGNVAARAKIALISGAWDDASLSDPDADPLDRAEALILQGDADRALTVLPQDESARGARLRAEALDVLGRTAEAKEAIAPLIKRMGEERIDDAPTLTEGVRALLIQARLEGRSAGDYQMMLKVVERAHQQIDRVYWPAKLVEAELLFDRDNRAEAHEAALEVLTLNPSCAEAWTIIGRMAVGGFDFGMAEKISDRLGKMRTRLGLEGTHQLGDVLLSMAWLRQNDPDLADQQLAPTLARFPKFREALGLRAAAEAVRYNFDHVEAMLKEYDALSPGSPEAIYAVGRALAEARQYGPATEYLKRAIERQPNWAAPITELGLLYMQSGDDPGALATLRRAMQLDPFNVRAKNSLALVEDLSSWSIQEGEFFRVRAKTEEDKTVGKDMLGVLDEIHRRVAAEYEHSPPGKTMLELMPDHESFAVRITGMPALHTIAAATGPLIAMEAPRSGKGHNGEYDWARVIQHEYTHTVTLSLTKNRIPHWFTEAAAVHMEMRPRDYNTCQLLIGALTNDALFDMRKINVAFVRPEGPNDRALAYAQGHWMYEYIVQRWGKKAPIDLMKLYAEGVRQPEAMLRVLGIDENLFLADFKEWARNDAATWGMLPVPSLDELRMQATMKSETARGAAGDELASFAAAAAQRLAGGAASTRYGVNLVEPNPDLVRDWSGSYPDHPDVLELLVQQALEASGHKATEEMIPLLEKYAAARPVDPMPHRELARLYLASEDKSRAIEHLEFLDLREQSSPAYAAELAKRYEALKQWDKAKEKAERAVQIGPYDGNQRELAARIDIQAGDLAAAERHILALTVLEPQFKKHQERLEAVRKMIRERGS